MRFIGSITDSADASRFGDYLTSIEIANSIEQGSSGFSVWVHDDDKLDSAKLELEQFSANPADAKYEQAGKIARKRVEQVEKKQLAMRKNYIDFRTRASSMAMQPAPVTIALIVLSLLTTLVTKFGNDEAPATDWLSIGRLTDSVLDDPRNRAMLEMWIGRRPVDFKNFMFLPPASDDIRHGQVWRLVTPIFIHLDWLHIIFNMMWLYQLGNTIEKLRGTRFMLMLALVSGILGNIAQFYWTGPRFGGMSGVVYALFGYLWIKSIVSPGSVIVPKNTVTIMLVWLAIGMLGIINMGNAAHLIGLITGMVIAHAPHSWKKMRRAMTQR